MPLYILVMSHDNDNARSFAAGAACGGAAVTPLISARRVPTSASHTWLDWTQSKKRNDPCMVHLVMLHI